MTCFDLNVAIASGLVCNRFVMLSAVSLSSVASYVAFSLRSWGLWVRVPVRVGSVDYFFFPPSFFFSPKLTKFKEIRENAFFFSASAY